MGERRIRWVPKQVVSQGAVNDRHECAVARSSHGSQRIQLLNAPGDGRGRVDFAISRARELRPLRMGARLALTSKSHWLPARRGASTRSSGHPLGAEPWVRWGEPAAPPPRATGRRPFSQNSHARTAAEITLKTIPGNPTTHLLLNDLTECQTSRKRGLDVLELTLLFGAQTRAPGIRRRRTTIALAPCSESNRGRESRRERTRQGFMEWLPHRRATGAAFQKDV